MPPALAKEMEELVVEVPMLLMMMKAGIGGFGDKTKEDAAFDPKSKTENDDIRGKDKWKSCQTNQKRAATKAGQIFCNRPKQYCSRFE